MYFDGAANIEVNAYGRNESFINTYRSVANSISCARGRPIDDTLFVTAGGGRITRLDSFGGSIRRSCPNTVGVVFSKTITLDNSSRQRD